jgi:DMSO/TMAO reductase YedYZ molybdopterin-dependent catalytic subunit
MLTEGGKPSWPLFLKGDSVLGGQQVGGIARIELNNLPEPPAGWTLSMLGEVGDTITQQEFEDGLACTMSGHLKTWTDLDGNTWSGVPLWVLLGAVDDIELTDHWTFSDTVASAGYTVQITAADGFSKTYTGTTVARNDNYIVANKMNDEPLSDSFPLRLVGSAVTRTDGTLGGSAIGQIARIEILELQTPPAAEGSYNLALKGKITDVLSQAEIEQGLACPSSGHLVTWTQEIKDTSGTVIETHEWSGIPLWFLVGWVDDRVPHEFNAVQASAGYKIIVKASDGYAKDFQAADVAWSNDYIIATMKDGAPLPTDKWPLQLVGDPLTRADGTLGGMSVSKVAEIELTEFGVPTEIPKVHIVKYGDDGTTIIAEATVDYTQLQEQFPVVGDGQTQYKYQGVTMDPTDIWGVSDETKGGYKITNAVKGTRVADLVSLVGGMGEGTDIVFVASDGFKTTLPYTCIFTTPDIQARQGDAILAWYADGKYVPGYADGMRLFFMPEDTIYGQWDMHETIPPGYWHYYYQAYLATDPVYSQYAPGILYPSCAGLSAKYVTEIRVYTTPESSWDLHLDGTRVGGIEYTIAKGYFEAALACQMGANHEASYTDASGNVWTGMPLWFLQGFVDDADQHSNNAYNQSLAEAGYDIIVTASDGYGKTFSSVDTVRSTGYIVANTLNGYHIPESDSSWPLRLVGTSVSKSNNVKKVSDITLNFRPVIDSLTIPTDPVKTETPAEATAFFTDPYDTHTAVFDWGDGTTSVGVVDEAAHSITGSHAYTVNGFYTVKVTLTDSMGVAATKTCTEYLVIYDGIGEASGSGTIQVGADDIPWDPAVIGQASFSLTAKYIKDVPSGNAKLGIGKSQFTAAFFDYIVINNGIAYIHGMGSIDKSAPDYEFLLIAHAGGKGGSDTYRLQIWDLNMNKVFDNAPEAGDMLNPDATSITGGSIVIKV